MLIDAHQHFWTIGANGQEWPTPSLLPLYRDYGPADLTKAAAALPLQGTVLVQSQPNDADTNWLLQVADSSPLVRAVVGWVDLMGADAPERIARLSQHPKMRGLRPMLQSLDDDDWIAGPMLDPALDAMVTHRLTLDALVLERHLPALTRVAERRADLGIVINHGAKPQIGNDCSFSSWAGALAKLATFPNVVCKLSGLVTEAEDGAAEAEFAPYFRHLVDCFGPDRLMWGSDWPVVNLRSDYAQWHAMAVRLSGLDGQALQLMLHGAARRFYRI
jgi:L-fuconolactonase